ncbi:MAG: hypothetical protein WB755_09235 [Terriglobales bacterium]
MLSKCANPGCPAPFLYLHQGKLFRMDTNSEVPLTNAATDGRRLARRLEFFWLCDQCAVLVTLNYRKGVGVTAVPLSKTQASETQVSENSVSSTQTLVASAG